MGLSREPKATVGASAASGSDSGARLEVESIIANARGGSAAQFQDDVHYRLRCACFVVHREVYVDNRGDGRRGRVDLVAFRGDLSVALELDNKVVRPKSATKLRQVRARLHCVALRPSRKVYWLD